MTGRKKLEGQARNIIYNVIKFFDDEKFHRRSKYSFLQVNEKAAAATGVSLRTITSIRQEGKVADATSSKIKTPIRKRRIGKYFLDTFDLAALKDIITSFYTLRKEVPTSSKILEAARQHLDYKGSISTLRKTIIQKLGYRFKKCKQNKIILVEKEHIRAWRAKYLRAIRANDALGDDKKPVIYLDETWVHADDIVKKSLQFKNGKGSKIHSTGRRWLLVHAGCNEGFVEGACLLYESKTCQDEMNGEIFKKWVNENLIPNLKEPSIIVMDNASYHSILGEKIPSLAASKSHIQNWLREKGIPFDENMSKSELYMIIKEKNPPKKYEIDEIFESHGHEVFRIPPYNSELNPIEFIWDVIKQRIILSNVDQKCVVDSLTLAINSITKDDWVKEIDHVKQLENTYWENEALWDSEDFIMHVGDESESNTSWDDEESDDAMSGIEITEDNTD